jgi:hypothetical protein
MLLFESEVWGSILHTGDCRVTSRQLPDLAAALDELLGEGPHLGLLCLDVTAGGGQDGADTLVCGWAQGSCAVIMLTGALPQL